MRVLRVGMLAKQTGVSVRTLHYYDEIGLLTPSHHSAAGYRLYDADDVRRLQQIKSLRQVISLDEIQRCLGRSNFSLPEVIDLHLQQLNEQIALQHTLRDRLELIAARFRAAEEVSVDDFIVTMEVMSRMDKYYTPEQQEYLKERRQTIGDERIHEVEAEWPQLMKQVGVEIDKGTDPASEAGQALAKRWMSLVKEFSGGNTGIEHAAKAVWNDALNSGQKEIAPGVQIDPRMGEYMAFINKAMAASKGE